MKRKNAIVTGASEGIGREFCKRLAREGYAVLAVARNADRLQSLLTELAGADHEMLVVDLAQISGWTNLIERLTAKHYDILINNAGSGILSEFTALTAKAAGDMVMLNCSSLMALSHAYLRQAQSGDALINVASVLAYAPSPHVSVYAATKAFVATLTEALWFEQHARGVYVMNLSPGSTSTEFHNRAGMKRASVPKFMIQTPGDVVDAAFAALKRRTKPIVVPGVLNKLLVMMFRILPRRLTIRILGQGRSASPPS